MLGQINTILPTSFLRASLREKVGENCTFPTEPQFIALNAMENTYASQYQICLSIFSDISHGNHHRSDIMLALTKKVVKPYEDESIPA